jgi:hypothetical protein
MHTMQLASMGRYRSGQTGQTVNLLALRLPRFESLPAHHQKSIPERRSIFRVFTARLELILSRIAARNQPLRPAAVPQDGTPRGKIAFTISDLRAPPKNSSNLILSYIWIFQLNLAKE